MSTKHRLATAVRRALPKQPSPAVLPARRHLHSQPQAEALRADAGAGAGAAAAVPRRRASTSASASSSPLAQHLNGVFAPLDFPPELAARILTHLSHKDAAQGHNARFSFVGRRVLDTYLLLFLHALPPALLGGADYARTAERALNTYVLGEHVAPRWGVPGALRWAPARTLALADAAPRDLRAVGLHKVAGTAVEAVVGGVFHQFGGAVAHRLFQTRVLPHILLPGQPMGLPDSLHAHAREVIAKMGGENGPLVL
ncbi:hypothetical protein FA95DRAFT_1005870 [Auriscalpium vulgare]|uniref:Uncharacterized protein n=1 Tax=Auriscalpium vulgare TaxID=40419 RepID=A0ACB8RYV5_9AGAM|nr:hypothetical protein FA95DRAFT_1005870 [Auriscalpium vulgare]